MSLRLTAATPPSCDVATTRRALEAAAVEARRWNAVHPPTALSPLRQTSDARAPVGDPVDDILGLVDVRPSTMITVKGLLQYKQFCQVNQSYNSKFGCRDKDLWRSLLQYAEAKTLSKDGRFTYGAKLLSTTTEVDESVANLGDDDDAEIAKATAYKRAFTDYVIYRALVGHEAYKDMNDYRRDAWSTLIWFDSQVRTFLSRSNGSIPNVIQEIKRSTKALRKMDPSYPPIPSDFYVGAVKMIIKANDAYKARVVDWGSKGGYDNIPKLIEAIKKNQFY